MSRTPVGVININSAQFSDYVPLYNKIQELRRADPDITSVEVAKLLDTKLRIINELWSQKLN